MLQHFITVIIQQYNVHKHVNLPYYTINIYTKYKV